MHGGRGDNSASEPRVFYACREVSGILIVMEGKKLWCYIEIKHL